MSNLKQLIVNNEHLIREKLGNSYFGKVFRNFTLQDDWFIQAIDQIAGPKIFNYIVSDPDASTTLDKNRLLEGDYNIIPNSHIRSFQMSEHKIIEAKRIAQSLQGEVWYPLEVIQFDP